MIREARNPAATPQEKALYEIESLCQDVLDWDHGYGHDRVVTAKDRLCELIKQKGIDPDIAVALAEFLQNVPYPMDDGRECDD